MWGREGGKERRREMGGKGGRECMSSIIGNLRKPGEGIRFMELEIQAVENCMMWALEIDLGSLEEQ